MTLTLYTQPGCIHCDHAKTHLREQDVAFETVDIREDAEALAFLRERGHSTVPQLYVGDVLIAPGGGVSIRQLSKTQIDTIVAEAKK